MSTPPKTSGRGRSSSVTQALKQIPLNQQNKETSAHAQTSSEVKPLPGRPRPRRDAYALPDMYKSRGLINDLQTGRWMLVPSSSLVLVVIPICFYIQHAALEHFGILDSGSVNPFALALFPSGQVSDGKYRKNWFDLIFITYYVIVWSFVRQFCTIHILRPLAKRLGIKGGKIERFTEQGYAVMYFSFTTVLGIYVMWDLPVWWFKTPEFWIHYPQRIFPGDLKAYYLLQFAYWLQQTILIAGRVEKPRKDFKELVAHHIVTLWLIGWSYVTYMTLIGICIFITMDISDIFLAFAKCVNYVDERYSAPPFAFFVVIWTYFRHYLNIIILKSVWTEFNLIPEAERQAFRPLQDQWMAPWLRYQIFVPILILQFINLFWYFLILRILYRAVFGQKLADERSDDEDEDEEPSTEDKIKMLKGDKAE